MNEAVEAAAAEGQVEEVQEQSSLVDVMTKETVIRLIGEEGSTAIIDTADPSVRRKLERLGFEGTESEGKVFSFEVPKGVVEITSRAVSRANRPKREYTDEERQAIRDRLQAGKARKAGNEVAASKPITEDANPALEDAPLPTAPAANTKPGATPAAAAPRRRAAAVVRK